MLGAPADIDAVYNTQFNSTELNVSYDFDSRFTGFVGARSVWVNDSLDVHFHFPGFNVNAAGLWNVDTFGVGPQIGSLWQVVKQGELAGPLSGLGVSLDGRVGYLWTSSGADFSAVNDFGPITSAHGGFNGGTVIAEGGIKLLYTLWRNLTLEAGYRVVYLDAVPTAAGSVGASHIFTAETIDKTSEPLLVHGGTLGVSAHF